MGVILPRKPLPINRSLLWSPAQDPSAPFDAILGGEADPYVLFLTQRALIDIDSCVLAATDGGGTAFGLLAGERFHCPSTDTRYMVISSVLWAPDLVVRQSAIPPDTLAAAARTLRALPGQEVLGWYRSGTSVETELSPADRDVHLKFFLMRWHVMLFSAPNADPPVGGVFAVDRASMHSGRVPFHELLHSSSLRSSGPKPTCVAWRNYVCDEPVVPLSDAERDLVRATADSDEGDAVPHARPSPPPGGVWQPAQSPRPPEQAGRSAAATQPATAAAGSPALEPVAPPIIRTPRTPVAETPATPLSQPTGRPVDPRPMAPSAQPPAAAASQRSATPASEAPAAPVAKAPVMPGGGATERPPLGAPAPRSVNVEAELPPRAASRSAVDATADRAYDPDVEAGYDAPAVRAHEPVAMPRASRSWRNDSSAELASHRASTSGLFGGWARNEAEQVLLPMGHRSIHHRRSRRAVRLLLAALGALALIASVILALREYPATGPAFAGGSDRGGGDVLQPAVPSDSLLSVFDQRAAALTQAIASYGKAEQ
ncbi:MAG: hypothetical protein M3336_13760, partial [Chloroflexota bacterium]|nr:hypothetical protein [Chloroflexota bacterium]